MTIRSVFGHRFPFLFRSSNDAVSAARPATRARRDSRDDHRASRFLRGLFHRRHRSTLDRYLKPQRQAIDRVLRALGEGRMDSDRMWFVFPRLAGPGNGASAQEAGLQSIEEAGEYLRHPVLKRNLSRALTTLQTRANAERDAVAIFGGVDAAHLHACVTLFLAVCDDDDPLRRQLSAIRRRLFWNTDHAGTRQRLEVLGVNLPDPDGAR